MTRRLCEVRTARGGSGEILQIISDCLPEAEIKTLPSASPGADVDLHLKKRGSGRARVLLLGHYDTVDIESPPPRIEDGRLRALGSFDMKGGLAIALRLFSEADPAAFHSLELLVVGDEETRSRPMVFSGSWDAVLAFEGGEPDGPVIARFGASKVKIGIEGAPTRATFPLESPSTVLLVAELLPFLQGMNCDTAHFTAAAVRADSACNVVASWAEITGVLRYGTDQECQRWISGVPEDFHKARISLEVQELIPALSVKAATRSLLDRLGIPFSCRSGASDISWLRGQAPILIDGLGPLGGGEHSPDEFIVLDSLEIQFDLAWSILQEIFRDGNAPGKGF